ncbi:jg9982 [Pararge aegeria aegeria]|uniref:Jg9982 protein n=1 Tax=Pararge aegeria aegeria TaxID=348720 RepID=A0A8S4S8L2_9NEOP|nr:jg9982 [Pararge aegeria aegeria]
MVVTQVLSPVKSDICKRSEFLWIARRCAGVGHSGTAVRGGGVSTHGAYACNGEANAAARGITAEWRGWGCAGAAGGRGERPRRTAAPRRAAAGATCNTQRATGMRVRVSYLRRCAARGASTSGGAGVAAGAAPSHGHVTPDTRSPAHTSRFYIPTLTDRLPDTDHRSARPHGEMGMHCRPSLSRPRCVRPARTNAIREPIALRSIGFTI